MTDAKLTSVGWLAIRFVTVVVVRSRNTDDSADASAYTYSSGKPDHQDSSVERAGNPGPRW